MAEAVPSVTLSSGFEMPMLAFGTASAKPSTPDRLTEIFLDGMKAGYRHFDTAHVYGTEAPLGNAIAEAVRAGIVRSREEVFITSKLWCYDAAAELVVPALMETLRDLGLDYLDLYLIHFPARLQKKRLEFPHVKSEPLPFDMKSTWAGMEECKRLGLARSIGVSNFTAKKISDILSFATIPPAVNQVEMHPLWDQRKLRGVCGEHSVHVSAFSPLGGGGTTPWATSTVLDCPVLGDVAQRKGKTVAQVCLRWVAEQGVSVVVKSFDAGRMRENLQVFGCDWGLDEDDKKEFAKIPQKRGNLSKSILCADGTTTPEEAWDGEI